MESICETANQWSERGMIISGHNFYEVEQPDDSKQVLKCRICGIESVAYFARK